MYDWVLERHSEKELLTGPLLIAQAKVFHDVMGIENDCVYSMGWLNRFKNRYGIRLSMSGEVKFIKNSNQKAETQTQTKDSESSPKRREQPKRTTRSNKSAIYKYNSSDEDTENATNLEAPSSSTSKLKSALLSGMQYASLAGTSDNATILDSPIVFKQKIIETEEDSLISFYPPSASCSRDSFVKDSERHSPLVSSSGKTSNKSQNSKSHPKRVKKSRQNSSVACSSKDSDSSRAPDSFGAFGVFVASKLRTLDWKSCAFVQKAFTDVLFEAELGLFLTPEEKTSFEKKSDSLVFGLHEAFTDVLFEAELGLFLTPEEKTSFEKKSDSLVFGLHEAFTDIPTAQLSSHAESVDSISSCAEISTS